ncbi:MAG: DUF1345 domain-containing protein [Bacteriovorax sp.]
MGQLEFSKYLSLLEKVLVLYNVFQWSYLFFLLYLIFTSSYKRIKERAILEDEGANFVLALSSISSVITLVTIALELGSAKDAHGLLKSVHLVLPAITLIGVWALLPTMYAIHYAHLYYLTENESKRPVKFPDNPDYPDYFDFLYFSVTIALASQTADVSVNSKRGRRLVLVQSVLAFLFNTSVLALGINVAASLLN